MKEGKAQRLYSANVAEMLKTTKEKGVWRITITHMAPHDDDIDYMISIFVPGVMN